jgi:hypothetical protein
MAGRAAVHYANLVKGDFPRSLEAGYLKMDQRRRQSIEGVAYHFSDRDAGSFSAPDGVQAGSGIGLVGSFRRTGLDLRGDLAVSDVHYQAGDERQGRTAGIRGRADRGPLTLSGRYQETGGTAYEVGSLGILQPTPRRIEDVNLSVRPGAGFGLSAWAGRWRYPPSFLADTLGSNVERYSLRGNRGGVKLSWKSPRGGTGLSASREFRRRSLEHGSEDVVTRNASVSQRFRRGLNASLIWNQLDYTGRAPHDYVTGSVSLRVGRGGTLTLQQRTLWQEPVGPRLESIADLSSIRALAGRLLLSAQIALRHEGQEDGRFHRVQTQGRLSGDYRLGRDVRFSGRYQLSHSPGGDVHTIDLALSHQLGRTSEVFPGSGLDPVGLDRQIVIGRVFDDRNHDGKWQSDEPGIPGVEIAIDEETREPVVTDVSGVYRAFLRIGRHFLRLLPASVPIEYALDGAGPIALEVMSDRTAGHDFALRHRAGSIEGFVLDDRSGEGVPDVRIYLRDHLYTYTDATGAYRFQSLPTGDYDVRIDTDTLPFGYRPVGSQGTRVRVEESGEVGQCVFRVSRPIRVTEF